MNKLLPSYSVMLVLSAMFQNNLTWLSLIYVNHELFFVGFVKIQA